MPVTNYGAGADTSRFQLRYYNETAWGETPGVDGVAGPAPTFTEMRATGESLTMNESTVQSEEIRSDRSITDLVRTGFEASGDTNYEVSFGSYDDFFQGALFSTWSNAVDFGPASVSIVDATTNSQIIDDGASGAFSGFTAGQWIRVSGLTAASEDGYYRIISVDGADTITVAPQLTAVTNDAAVSVKSSGILRNGTTAHSFSIEKEFADVTQFFLYQGMMVSAMEMNFAAEEILGGAFTFMGKTSVNGGATYGDGTPTAAASTQVMNSVNHLSNLRESGTVLSDNDTFLRSMSISLDNGLRGQKAIGDAGNVGVGLGRCNVTGTIEMYFIDGALYGKFIAETEISFDWRIVDTAGNAYIFTMPRVKLTSPTIAAGAADEDVIASFEFQALRDPVTGATLQIDRIPA
ncbi:phage tail tube protein [uncultured Roseibium sp.]|uniref:phage tail tube protein n=1 Tax=uncultured Roseibium sp. TaxID=1936171 RepID=UPI002626526F|nr:phage tail tube protein [uncultured Roseibium sp.]